MTDASIDTTFALPSRPSARTGGDDLAHVAGEALPVAGRVARLARRLSQHPWVLLLGGFGVPAGLGMLLDEGLFNLAGSQALSLGGLEATGGGLGFAALASVIAARRVVRPEPRDDRSPGDDDLTRAIEILGRQPNAAAGLVRLGDKKLLFSDCGEAFVMYARRGRSMVALFDPVGARHAWAPLVLKFMAEARRQSCRPVFYQVSANFLPIAVEAGLKPYKLGEQAIVDLTSFSLAGGDWLKLRRSINRAERDGLVFELLEPAEVGAVIGELAEVSDAWLAEHNCGEKGFSLGTFQENYVASEPVAVVRLEGRIVAFASILTTASGGDAFIDLMRHRPGVHRGLMDLLFVRIMEHLKERGFRRLDLGMAPLANLSTHRRAPLWNHLGQKVFETGERFYNFRGVLAFKSKFDPLWQPRYLAVSGPGLPLVSLLDVTLLIGGGLKGMLRR